MAGQNKEHRIVVFYTQHAKVKGRAMLTLIREAGFARDENIPFLYSGDGRVKLVGRGSSEVAEKLKLITGVISVISAVE